MSIYNNITEKNRIKAKFKRFVIRRILRGSFILKRNNNRHIINAFKEDICKKKFTQIENKSYKILFGNLFENREILLRHLLIKSITQTRFNWFILFCIGSKIKIIYPLPLHWLKNAKNHNLDFNFSVSLLIWYFCCIYIFFKSLIKIFIVIIKFPINKIIFKKLNLGKYIYFANIGDKSQISKIENHKYNNLVHWFIQNTKNNFDLVCHSFDASINHSLPNNKELKYINSEIPTLSSYKSFFLFCIWSFFSSLIIFIDLFRGRWWNAYCYEEIIKSKLVELDNGKNLAQEYLFNNSSMRFRPGWTYLAEKLGSKITFYFYSLNNDKIRDKNSNLDEFYWGLKQMTWPRYLTWNESHVKILRRLVGIKPNIMNVGYIPLSSNNLPSITNHLLKKKYIAIFPVQPLRKIHYASSSFPITEVDFINVFSCIKFLRDIISASKNIDIHLVIKQKRKIGPILDPAYKNFMLELENNKNLTLIDEYTSAEYLIENSIGVISFPFTSTAYISSNLTKKNIFYDVTKKFLKDDPNMHNIPCINNYNVLQKWMIDSFNKKI